VENLYNAVQALPADSSILLSFDYDPASKEELYPMSLAILRHCFERGLHPVVMTHWIGNIDLCRELVNKTVEEAVIESNRDVLCALIREHLGGGGRFQLGRWLSNVDLCAAIFEDMAEQAHGRDYVYLGFRPGGSQLILNMGENFKAAFPRDIDQKPTEGMPVLADVYSLRDFPVVIAIAAGGTTDGWWIAYGADRFKFKLGAGCTAVIAPDLYPYLQSGQLIGMAAGLRGAADYEVLLGRHGQAYAGMPAQSIAHVLMIVLILGANLHFLLRRKLKEG
jgi:hypothetical protein